MIKTMSAPTVTKYVNASMVVAENDSNCPKDKVKSMYIKTKVEEEMEKEPTWGKKGII